MSATGGIRTTGVDDGDEGEVGGGGGDGIGWMGQQPGWVGFVNFGFAPVCLEGVLRGH